LVRFRLIEPRDRSEQSINGVGHFAAFDRGGSLPALLRAVTVPLETSLAKKG
jgi:hypothetical protein